MKGDDKGNFNPTNSLKRCEAVKMLATIHNMFSCLLSKNRSLCRS